MKYFVPLFFLFAIYSPIICSQIVANEWINYNQQYFKVKIAQEGVYKLTYADLQNAGFDLHSVDARNIQLFARGEEIPIYIEGENDGIFNEDDFILFCAEKNDGWFDSLLYKDGQVQANPYYSLYNDTICYFITANKNVNNKRYSITEEYSGSADIAYNYCIAQSRNVYASNYYQGIQGPVFTTGETWASSIFAAGKSFKASMGTPYYYQVSGFTAKVYVGLVGVSRTNHMLEVQFGGNTKEVTASGLYANNIRVDAIDALDNVSEVMIVNKSSTTDNNAVSYVLVEYPHTLQFENYTYFSFKLPVHDAAVAKITVPVGKSYLLLEGSDKIWVNSNADNVLQVQTSSVSSDKGVFVAESALKVPDRILPVGGNGFFTDFTALERQGDFVIFTHSSLLNAAQNYANYKASVGYSPVVVDVEKLYDQYAYGIAKHPLALRNFSSMALAKWVKKPSYFFVLGKGLHATSYRKNADFFKMCKVPSMGIPSSDNMITEGLTTLSYVPSVPIGRLSATSEYDVNIYLEKLKEFDGAVPDEWMKTVLHFGGGKDAAEQDLFKRYLSDFENIIVNSDYAGDVFTVLKNSSEAIEISKLDIVKKKINAGTSLMNFFGHSSSTGFDQDIDDPESYRNEGKYPFLFASSCYSGDIFTTATNSISERWVLIEKRGVMAFIASVNLGYATYLYAYQKSLIHHFSEKYYGKSIGFCMMKTADSLMRYAPKNSLMGSTCLDITTHGDPSLRLYSHEKPDYKIISGNIFFSPSIVTTAVDSFAVDAVIVNAGRSIYDTIVVRSVFVSPNKDTVEKRIYFYPKGFRDTVRFYFYHQGLLSMGQNMVQVEVDYGNTSDEYNEENNIARVNFPIYANAMVPILPQKYGIVPFDSVTLVASFAGATSVVPRCVFQVDTVANFSSSFVKEYTVEMKNQTIEFQLPFKLNANVVYYWRVRSTDDQQWIESTFTYKAGISGWSQSSSKHFGENIFDKIVYTNKGESEFVKSVKKLYCSTKGSASNDNDYKLVKLTLDGGMQAWGCCGATPAINIAVIDSLELQSWTSDAANFGHRNYPTCSGIATKQFNFTSQSAQELQGMAAMLDSVENGNYIILQTFRYGYFDSWDNSVFEACENVGANFIRSVPNNYPYIFFVKKGYPHTAIEVMGNSPNELIEIYADINGLFDNGRMLSPVIGPSSSWHNVVSNVRSFVDDDYYINIYGIGKNGESVLLKDRIVDDTLAIHTLVNARQYPYLQLEFITKNTQTRIPAEVMNWEVWYNPTAEIAVDISANFSFYNDTIDEGENIELTLMAVNVGSVGADTILIRKGIRNENNAEVISIVDTVYGIAPFHSIFDTAMFSSFGLTGNNKVYVEFNVPNADGDRFLQEVNYFNNNYTRDIFVRNDVANPVTEVLFDGRFVKNGDIVSPQPAISIYVFDENDFFSINDTSLFNVYIGNKETFLETRIPYLGIQYGTAISIDYSEQNNSVKLLLSPQLDNGKYYLKVKAMDVKGNYIATDYVVEFAVDSIPSVSNVRYGFDVYSGNSYFYFTITGSVPPQKMQIDVLSVDGRVVNRLDFSHNLKLGENKIIVDWDGTDYTGKNLINGLYYYHVYFDDFFNYKHDATAPLIGGKYGILHLFR